MIFIDDIGMPEKEQFGARPPIELLRQVVDMKFIFDKKEKQKIEIKETNFLCIGAVPESGLNDLST